MEKKPSISQYLISTCLFIIDELNEKYSTLEKRELKEIADQKFNEMDITVRIGYHLGKWHIILLEIKMRKIMQNLIMIFLLSPRILK